MAGQKKCRLKTIIPVNDREEPPVNVNKYGCKWANEMQTGTPLTVSHCSSTRWDLRSSTSERSELNNL